MAEEKRKLTDLMQHDTLVGYDPHDLYGGEQSFGKFTQRVFPWSHVELSDVPTL